MHFIFNNSFLISASSVSPQSQKSPSLSQTSTTTTYSLPYYHNLFSRTQPQDSKRVHATTYVPEVGTVSSPVAGAPAVIQVKESKPESDDVQKRHKSLSKESHLVEKGESRTNEKDETGLRDRTKSTGKIVVKSNDTKQNAKGDEKACSDSKSFSNVPKDKTSEQGCDFKKKERKQSGNWSANKARSEDIPFDKNNSLHHSGSGSKESRNTSGSVIKDGTQTNKCLLKTNKTEKSEIQNEKTVNVMEKTAESAKEVPSNVMDSSDVITVSDSEDKDNDKNILCENTSKTERSDEQSQKSNQTPSKERQTTVVKPIPVSKIETDDTKCTLEGVKNRVVESKHSETSLQPSGEFNRFYVLFMFCLLFIIQNGFWMTCLCLTGNINDFS